MISPSDADYQDTKRLKIDGTPLPPLFKQLAEWISAQYEVEVLNIILDTIKPGPRLNVVLEWAEDERKFTKPRSLGFDRTKQDAVRDKLGSIADDSFKRQTDIQRVLVIFTCFERVARTEANWRVTDDDADRLMRALNRSDLWKIRRNFEDAAFFFYTEAQAEAAEVSGAKAVFSEAYAAVVAPYDEFGYLAKRPIPVRLDSKENFESVYKGNWFYYDRDH